MLPWDSNPFGTASFATCVGSPLPRQEAGLSIWVAAR